VWPLCNLKPLVFSQFRTAVDNGRIARERNVSSLCFARRKRRLCPVRRGARPRRLPPALITARTSGGPRVSSIGLALQQEGRDSHCHPEVKPQLVAIANGERQRLPSNAKCWAEGVVPRYAFAGRPNQTRRASRCRVMTMTTPPNSDAPSVEVLCRLSVRSPVFRAYLRGYDAILLGAKYVSSSPSKRSLSKRNHSAKR